MDKNWGFLRETRADAIAAGKDKDTGRNRTGLEDYLAVIFPDISEDNWIHDKAFGVHGGNKYGIRPDYRCDKLNLMVYRIIRTQKQSAGIRQIKRCMKIMDIR